METLSIDRSLQTKNAPKTQRLGQYLLLLLLLVAPFVIWLNYVRTYAIDTPWNDDCRVIEFLRGWVEGKCNLLDLLFLQNNDHRVALPYAVLLLLVPFTHYNTALNIYAGQFFLGMTALLFLVIAWQRFKSAGITPFALVPVAWTILTLRQTQLLLFNIEIYHLMSGFFFVLSLFLLDRVSKFGFRFWAAAASAWCSAFSCANGLLALPLGTLLLAGKLQIDKDLPPSRRIALVGGWLLACVLIAASYFWQYRPTPCRHRVTWDFAREHLDQIAQFFCGFVASPVAEEPTAAIVFGSIFVVLCAITIWAFCSRHKSFTSNLLLPLMLIGYAVVSALLTTMGRAQLGIYAAFTSRYVGYATIGWMGLWLMLVSATQMKKAFRLPLICSTLACMCFGFVNTVLNERYDALEFRSLLLKSKNIVLNYKLQGPEALAFFCDTEYGYTTALIEYMERERLSVFQKPVSPSPKLPCMKVWPYWGTISRVNGNLVEEGGKLPIVPIDSSKASDIFLQGWCADPQTGKPAPAVTVSIDSKLDIPVAAGLCRRDIANSFKKESWLLSGYETSFRTNLLGKGLHDVTTKIMIPGGKAYVESSVIIRLNII